MVFWKTAQPARVPPSAASAGMDHSEEMLAEVDEPPDERNQSVPLPSLRTTESYLKTRTQQERFQRRESLLTRQLHSETEHSDDEHLPHPPRTLSTQSTWSNQSTASTAELTSDDGRSMPSPAISPPLPPTEAYNALPIHVKPLDKKVQIVGHEEAATAGKDTGSEKSVEATLGRKRCIMFACRGKEEAKPKASPAPAPAPVAEKPAESSPPKRKCMIKFACPMRAAAESKPADPVTPKRPVSPPPPQRRSSGLNVEGVKTHRGSDSTVTHASPKSIRKAPSITATAPTPTTTDTPRPTASRKLSSDSEDHTEATRFHEFASSEDEPEEWTKEATCHRSRLTVNDTLKKEIIIRKACEEVEEEVLEEEDEEEAEEEAQELGVDQGEVDVEEDEDDVDEDDDEESDDSDAGFHSDDEEGFAASDSEGEESDYEWWKPGGSTAATSVEHLANVHPNLKTDANILASSANSMSSGEASPRSFKKRPQHRRQGHARSSAIPIGAARLQIEDDELPDSTDFVCGTLDEDRPLEQAYINRRKELEAIKHKARPQDIDPTFPTSDPEMDEEDDEDLVEPEDSEGENMVHGEMDDDLDGPSTLRRRSSVRATKKPTMHRSPPPTARYHSPPPSKRTSKHHSPPPPIKHSTARSPPPRKLFGSSPRPARSPAPGARMTSPPNTRRSSPTAATTFMKTSKVLAERPQLTHTASLPRGGGLLLSRMCKDVSDDDGANTVVGGPDIPKRGAIDIVKGLEKKRQRRREKMWQKMCEKAAAKGEKAYKVKPGKGCQRMREIGMQLQEYHGKAEHILSL